MERLIEGAFAACLQQNRARFNARFAAARGLSPGLDAEAFGKHLRDVVAPVVEACAAQNPDSCEAVAFALYDLSLDLLAKRLIGSQNRHPVTIEGWRSILESYPAPLCGEPHRFAGSIFNALYNLARTPGARLSEWIEIMRGFGAKCDKVQPILQVGKIAAWRCGVPTMRDTALGLCSEIEPDFARYALGISDASLSRETILEQLCTDRWLHPAHIGRNTERQLRIVATAGAFRGFGGVFACPPKATCADGHFWVSDNESCWQLVADVFGASLHRCGAVAQRPQNHFCANFTVAPNGTVTKNSVEASIPELSDASSFASDGTTLAVTLPCSHAIYLLAETSSMAKTGPA
ncbi:MAG TPA: hypothetical protein VF719_08495 [Abditibacteriaceae bacterium]